MYQAMKQFISGEETRSLACGRSEARSRVRRNDNEDDETPPPLVPLISRHRSVTTESMCHSLQFRRSDQFRVPL